MASSSARTVSGWACAIVCSAMIRMLSSAYASARRSRGRPAAGRIVTIAGPAPGPGAAAPRAAAGGQPAAAAEPASGHPQRHQLRQRRRHCHRQEDRGRRPRHEAGRLRGSRGQEAAEGRDLRPRQDRRALAADALRAEGDPQRVRHGDRGEEAQRAALHPPARRLPRAPRQRHGRRASRSSTSCRTSSRRRTWSR